MAQKKTVFILLILCTALAACSSLCPLQHPPRCLPRFPVQDGWYGGDGAYSIALDHQRTLWLFGDTFVSEEIGRKDRIGMAVVMGNTLAISTCSADHDFSIRYFLKKQNSNFVPFFGDNEILWPQDPFIAEHALYVPLLVIQVLPDAPAPFNFKIAGHKIARIKDFSHADPRMWKVDYLDWTPALPPGIEALATTSIAVGPYIYFFPLYRHNNITGNILVRIRADRLENPTGAFEYLNRDDRWDKTLFPDRIKIIFSAAVSELTVRYHAPHQRWLAVYSSPADKGRKLLIQTSQKLDGSWSAPFPAIESVPELDPANPLYNPYTFCYAGKEHRRFAQNKDLLVTYVCNSSEDSRKPSGFLRQNLFLYQPVVRTVACPENICH